MGETKVTIMVIKVDLQCEKCYRKIKKVLCKFPQIRDQVYNESNNTVTIKVVCCSPEKIKQKICCKGGDTVKGIEIIVPKPPPPEKKPEKPKEPEKKPEKPKEPEKKPDKPKEPEKKPDKPKEPEKKPDKPKEPEKKPDKPKEPEKKPDKPKEPEKKPEKPPGPAPPPVTCYPPPVPAVPIGACCQECYEGRGGGPCYQGYGYPPQPRFYEGYYGTPVYDSWGGGGYRGGCYVSKCLSEENPSGCSIM